MSEYNKERWKILDRDNNCVLDNIPRETDAEAIVDGWYENTEIIDELNGPYQIVCY